MGDVENVLEGDSFGSAFFLIRYFLILLLCFVLLIILPIQVLIKDFTCSAISRTGCFHDRSSSFAYCCILTTLGILCSTLFLSSKTNQEGMVCMGFNTLKLKINK